MSINLAKNFRASQKKKVKKIKIILKILTKYNRLRTPALPDSVRRAKNKIFFYAMLIGKVAIGKARCLLNIVF